MENNERLEQYISNQRKGSSFTVILVVVLLALTGVTIYFANGKAEAENSLAVVANQANDLQQYWKYQDSLAKKNLNACDSGYRILIDSLLSLHKTANPESAPVQLNNVTNAPPINYVDVAQTIKSNPSRVVTNLNNVLPPSTIQVFIHYQSPYTDEMNTVSSQLKGKPYDLQKTEKLELSYKRQVRYFNTSDESIADNLAAQLSKATGNLYQTNFIDGTKTPVKQLEVWIGEKKGFDRTKIQKDYEQYIQKAN